MPRHRLAFFFEDEAPGDRDAWSAWLATAPAAIQGVSELGERRPFLNVAAPFPNRDQIATRRDDEAVGLAIVQSLATELQTLAASTSRGIRLLISGQPFGLVRAGGPEADLTAKLAEWAQLIESRPADEAEWERKGYVSLWAGTLPREDFDHLLKEWYGTGGPLSAFARALGISWYDHDLLERVHCEPVLAGTVIGRLSGGASFVDKIAAPLREQTVNAVVALYDADFSQRPRDAARKRLKFLGAYPYKKGA